MKKRTKTRKHLRGISEIAQGLYLIRVQEVHPRTGKMVDVKKRVRSESLEEVAQAHAKLRAEVLGDRDRARLKRLRLSNILPGKAIISIYAKPRDSVNSLSEMLSLL